MTKNKGYTSVPNSVLEDDRLSWGAKGIYAYLLSKADKDGKIDIEDLTNEARLAFEELEKEDQE